MESIKNFFDTLLTYDHISLFVMRLYLGFLFIYSGQSKIRKLNNFAQHNGLSRPVALVVVLFELIGGMGVGLGIYTQVAATMIIMVLLGALYFHIIKWKSPFWPQNKGWEYDLMLILMLLVILLSGGGSVALQASL